MGLKSARNDNPQARGGLGASCSKDGDCALACNNRDCDRFCDTASSKCTARLGLMAACGTKNEDFRCKDFGWAPSPRTERHCFSANTNTDTADKCRDVSSVGGPCETDYHCNRNGNEYCRGGKARQSPSSLARFLPVSQYLLEPASGVWVLECGVLTSREA